MKEPVDVKLLGDLFSRLGEILRESTQEELGDKIQELFNDERFSHLLNYTGEGTVGSVVRGSEEHGLVCGFCCVK